MPYSDRPSTDICTVTGTDLRPSDYLTHADGIRILTGGLDSFVASGEKEAVLPLVDEDDVRHGGYRLKGFMLLQSVHPRKLSTRRGEVTFDLEEGGPAPSMKLGDACLDIILDRRDVGVDCCLSMNVLK